MFGKMFDIEINRNWILCTFLNQYCEIAEKSGEGWSLKAWKPEASQHKVIVLAKKKWWRLKVTSNKGAKARTWSNRLGGPGACFPGKCFIFGFSELAGNALKTGTRYELYKFILTTNDPNFESWSFHRMHVNIWHETLQRTKRRKYIWHTTLSV